VVKAIVRYSTCIAMSIDLIILSYKLL
jgi:hypothetical protein